MGRHMRRQWYRRLYGAANLDSEGWWWGASSRQRVADLTLKIKIKNREKKRKGIGEQEVGAKKEKGVGDLLLEHCQGGKDTH